LINVSDVLPLLRKSRAGEHRDDSESRQHHLRIEQIHFVFSTQGRPVPFIYSGFGVA
jgi:hypothetical protein